LPQGQLIYLTISPPLAEQNFLINELFLNIKIERL